MTSCEPLQKNPFLKKGSNVRAKYEQGARKPRANGDEPVSRERTSQRGRGSEMALVACVFIYEAGINSDSDDRFWTLKVGGYPGCFINLLAGPTM
jgi:hypothetical protein